VIGSFGGHAPKEGGSFIHSSLMFNQTLAVIGGAKGATIEQDNGLGNIFCQAPWGRDGLTWSTVV
jgi:hypothetical protein